MNKLNDSLEKLPSGDPATPQKTASSAKRAWVTRRKRYGVTGSAQYGGVPRKQRPAGLCNGVLYCYGGCGVRYSDFPCDLSLPTPLWNRIAVGVPFDELQQGVACEGRGGVLCPTCIIQRLAALPDCTVVCADIEQPHRRAELEAATQHLRVERAARDSAEISLATLRGQIAQVQGALREIALGYPLRHGLTHEQYATEMLKLISGPPETP